MTRHPLAPLEGAAGIGCLWRYSRGWPWTGDPMHLVLLMKDLRLAVG